MSRGWWWDPRDIRESKKGPFVLFFIETKSIQHMACSLSRDYRAPSSRCHVDLLSNITHLICLESIQRQVLHLKSTKKIWLKEMQIIIFAKSNPYTPFAFLLPFSIHVWSSYFSQVFVSHVQNSFVFFFGGSNLTISAIFNHLYNTFSFGGHAVFLKTTIIICMFCHQLHIMMITHTTLSVLAGISYFF